MKLGKLGFVPVECNFSLVGKPVEKLVKDNKLSGILVVEIDPNLADTTAFCEKYNVGLDISANCVVIEAKRADRIWYAACMILATDRVDVNNIVRRKLDARKISFAPMDTAVKLTDMEYGGITPVGLPPVWPIIIDMAVSEQEHVVIGSGLRKSKLLVPSELLTKLPNATVMPIAKP